MPREARVSLQLDTESVAVLDMIAGRLFDRNRSLTVRWLLLRATGADLERYRAAVPKAQELTFRDGVMQ